VLNVKTDYAASLPDQFQLGDLLVDVAKVRVHRGEIRIPLPKLSFDVLVALARAAPKLVPIDDLLRSVWQGLVVNPETVAQRIKLLRGALGDNPRIPRYIESLRGRGYRLLPDVIPMPRRHREFPTSGPIAPALVAQISLDPKLSAPPSSAAGSQNLLPLPDRPSLAVLPFIILTRDADQEYFAEGVMDEVVTALTRIRSLFVIASSATKCLKNQALDPRDVGRRLGVRYILEGSVRRSNPTVRIAVKLIDAQSGAQLWAESFDDKLEDVFALQDRVALSVAGIIEPNIQAAELNRVRRGPVENLGCYDLHLRAAHLRATLRKKEVIDALALLERALTLDSEFAPALAQAAGCHSQLYFNHWTDDRESHRVKGLIMADRAVRAGSGDAAVLAQVAGAVMDLDPGVDRAIGLIERATTLNPGSAYAWFISGLLQLSAGHSATALEHLNRAARLDPISRLNEIARVHLGTCHALLGDFNESLRIFRATTYRTPRLQLTLLYVCSRLGLWSEACEELKVYKQLTHISPEAMLSQMPLAAEDRASILDAFARLRSSAIR